MSDISPLEDGGACETLGTNPSVPATLDNLLRKPADSESEVRVCHGKDRPAESLTRGDRTSFPLPFVQILSKVILVLLCFVKTL